MQNRTKRFEVGSSTQDRIKIPRGFWIRMKSTGLSPAAILRHARLPLTVCGGETRVTTVQLFAIWQAVRDLSKDPTLGWEGMRQLASDQYPPPLLAALHARTYRDSIERLARYKKLCGAEEFRITAKGDEALVEISWPFAGDRPAPEVFIDAVFALVIELGRRGTKTALNPKRLELARPRERANPLEKYFGCPVKYGADRDALVFRAADVELPFATHNEELLQMLAPELDKASGDERGQRDVLEQVKWILKRLLAGSRPDLAMVAKELGMGERTLQRRITNEGATFRKLLDETRHELARQYLGTPLIELTEAAFLVGFEDPNSFYRAFRSWEGKTPAEWRAAHRNPPQRTPASP